MYSRQKEELGQRIATKTTHMKEMENHSLVLKAEVDKMKRNLVLLEEELSAKQTDKEQIKNILKTMNPKKPQPKQGSFDKRKGGGMPSGGLRQGDISMGSAIDPNDVSG